MQQETISIRTEVYEDMVFRYMKAMDHIMELELEIYELQEELNGLKHKTRQ